MKAKLLVSFVAACLVLGFFSAAYASTDEELKDLKARFEKRYPTLIKLKDAGKVGEVHDGYAAAVKAEYLDQKSGDAADAVTIRDFLAAENGDRSRLYALLAERESLTADVYAVNAGKRNFGKAKPDHWLKPKDKEWVQKKDLAE